MSKCGECKLGCFGRDEYYCEENLGEEQCIWRLQVALSELSDRPTWTPCSEEMPNENEWVLCSCNNGCAILILKLKGKVWHKTESVEYLSKFVNAWMPLPSAYQGE